MVKIIYKNYEISKTTIMYEPYGTLKSIITSIYKTTNPLKISFEIFKSFIMGYSVHQVISWFIDIYEAASSK